MTGSLDLTGLKRGWKTVRPKSVNESFVVRARTIWWKIPSCHWSSSFSVVIVVQSQRSKHFEQLTIFCFVDFFSFYRIDFYWSRKERNSPHQFILHLPTERQNPNPKKRDFRVNDLRANVCTGVDLIFTYEKANKNLLRFMLSKYYRSGIGISVPVVA